MQQALIHVTIVVDDYDKAIDFYTNKLNLALTEDTKISDTKRWVLVTPKGNNATSLLLAKAANEMQQSRIGNQTGGRVFLFLHTDNFDRDYKMLIDNDITIVRKPSVEEYGKVAVFEDIYGNLWDLIELKKAKEFFHSTRIFTIKDASKIDFTISEIKKLKRQILLENGSISFEINQVQNDKNKIILWGCFRDEQSYNDHLNSKHLQAFFKLDLVKLENDYVVNVIA